MNGKNSRLRLTALSIYFGTLVFLLACTAVGIGSSAVQRGILQLDDGIVKVQNPTGGWEPLAGTSTFELVGALESTNPWTVAGRPLVTNESTRIAQGLQPGALVRARGTVLENGDWLAYSIEPVGEQPNQTIILIGRVTSVNPWVVNGITLNVTNDTVINGDIQVGMLARVEILLLEDGSWEVISISALSEIPAATGCATVVATVESVSGYQIKFLGWPTPVTVSTPTSYGNGDDTGVDLSSLQPGRQVLVVLCASEDNQLVITMITIIDEDHNDDQAQSGEKALVCHKPGKKGGHTLSISSSAVPAHLGHGDKLGPCP